MPVVSPAKNGGRGLKHLHGHRRRRRARIARQKWRAWIETAEGVYETLDLAYRPPEMAGVD